MTVSVGVSWNKIFAKLGSDMIKPSGMVIITKYNFKDIVWPLPVEELLFIGKNTKPKLNAMGIYTIGDLANTDVDYLTKTFGIKGEEMRIYANGLDETPVDLQGHVDPPKSIGNSTTPPSDINSLREAEIILQRLSESVSSRLRDEKMKGSVISVTPRDVNLKSFTRQRKIDEPTNLTTIILKTAMELLSENYDFKELPLRSIGINVSKLIPEEQLVEQVNLFEQQDQIKSTELTIDKTIDDLRERFGFHVVKRASALLNKETENFDAKKGNSVFPGRKKDYNLEENPDNKILYKKDKTERTKYLEYFNKKEDS